MRFTDSKAWSVKFRGGSLPFAPLASVAAAFGDTTQPRIAFAFHESFRALITAPWSLLAKHLVAINPSRTLPEPSPGLSAVSEF
jgi:hypothetical protein